MGIGGGKGSCEADEGRISVDNERRGMRETAGERRGARAAMESMLWVKARRIIDFDWSSGQYQPLSRAEPIPELIPEPPAHSWVSVIQAAPHLRTMSDVEQQDSSVLGKRVRDGADGQQEHETMGPPPAPAGSNDAQDDDSDEDMGPMPMPDSGAANGGVKKKRKGTSVSLLSVRPTHRTSWVVLPHERLFLDHLPSADRYYKSFMHRDVINYCISTKYV